MPLGTTVTNKVLPAFSGTASQLGQAFIAVETDQGPEGPVLSRSISEWIATFGPRSATSLTAYDWMETYFQSGGRRLYSARVINGGAVAAELTLQDASSKPTLLVKYATKGKAGNTYKIEVKVVSTTASIILLNSEGEVVEASPYGTQAELIAYYAKHTACITVVQSTASEHTSALPKELTATALAAGENATSVTDAERLTTLKLCTASYGPGSVAIPGGTTEAIHKGIAEWLATTKGLNRRGWLGIPDATSPATLISSKWTTAPPLSQQSYVGFSSSTCIIPGLTPGTTRKTSGTALLCALAAQAAATGNMNTATAGPSWPVSPWVLGFTNSFTHAQAEELVEAGINVWGEEQGQLCLVSGSFVTALSKESGAEGEIFWSFAATGERMALTYEGEPIMAEALNKRIDGQGHLIAYVQGRLQGLIVKHWEKEALFGDSAPEAGTVEVGEPINTLAAEQRGELSAQMQVRITESVQSSALIIISRPITATV